MYMCVCVSVCVFVCACVYVCEHETIVICPTIQFVSLYIIKPFFNFLCVPYNVLVFLRFSLIRKQSNATM